MSSLKFWFAPEIDRCTPAAVFLDAHAVHAPVLPQLPRLACEKPGPVWTIVEATREDEAALRESWETGEPVEISGVRFEMAVIARQRTWWRPALVRGRT